MSIFGTRKQQGGGLFLSIMQGTFRQKVDEHTEGAISRVNKQKNEVWELHHETVNGHIENVYLRKGDKYGNEIHIVVNNREAKQKVIITFPVSSSYTRKFLMTAGNIDFRAPVEFVPWHFEDKKKKGKFRTGWSFYQHDAKDQVPEFLKREDVPEIIETETVSGTKYDDTEALEYMWKRWLKIADKEGFKEPEKKDEEDDAPARQERRFEDEEEEGPPRNQQRSSGRKVESPDF